MILSQFPEIHSINTGLLALDIPCLVVSVKKERKGHVRELHQQLCQSHVIEGIKMVLYVEHTVDANDLPVALWRFCNNLDPRRDSLPAEQLSLQQPGKKWACMGFDGTIKTKAFDDFQRDWPNIIVAADETIASVDKKWPELGLGAMLPSPSLKFKGQMYGEEAVVTAS
ncbi:UbiD family decarboxylase domain-containing protein [Paraflavitalea speifideaquila]|uniref:UbiD family decarboxylase domain-containing protein n=1 Tax=Paraflavitalea speifideaquila TaxID=3076558 RepID=UPI0028EFE478|nr:UbiD family decarboxylase domain-containing protein [Paraflavitalea speifideiaquila]